MKPKSTRSRSHAQTGKATKLKKVDLKLARRVLEVVDFGLVAGLGQPIPGKMCIEAAVNFALGNPHGDEPECVGSAVRVFKVKLNDCHWSSDKARTAGMRKLAIAQLGSNKIDQMTFGKLMYLRGTQKLMPYVFKNVSEKCDPKYKEEYLKHAELCEKVAIFEEAKKACTDAYAYASASAAYAYAYAGAYAYADASAAYASAAYASAAYASAYAYADAYAYPDAYADAYAYADASAAYAYAYAAYPYAYADDNLLRLTANVGLECLIELKSPGTKWLWLCDEKRAA